MILLEYKFKMVLRILYPDIDKEVPPPPEVVWETTPVDYVATIVEILDNNRVRVDVSYEEGVK